MRKNPALGNPLGLLARLNLVAIHADLETFLDDEGRLTRYGWKDAPGSPERVEKDGTIIPAVPRSIDARRVPDAHSPKLDAVAHEIKRQRGCGHIAFCDNVAVHVWLKMVLVDAGIPAERIAILNAEAVKAVDDRLQTAQDFNGVPPMINGVPVPESQLADAGPDDVITEPVEPKYDVVIANAVAYEGMDLQTRTCQVHHLDLPYEPATLQQRNGRAVRQGNTIGELPIKYYLANKSLDGFRFGLIAGKLGWMDALIVGTARSTNNPAAQEQISLEDALIELSRDPEEERALRAEQAARRLEETRKKIAKASSAQLRAAAGRFALARQETDPVRAATLRADAGKLLDALAGVDRAAWPWLAWAEQARTRGMLVPIGGQAPVYEGLRVAYPNPVSPDVLQYTEVGKTDGQTIGVRGNGSAVWQAFKEADVNKLELRPGSVTSSWPEEEESVLSGLRNKLRSFYLGPKAWTDLGWHLAPDAFVERWWAKAGGEVLTRMQAFDGPSRFPVPVLFGDVIGFGLQRRDGKEPTYVFPPTEAGWNEYLARAVAGDKLKGSPMRSDIFDHGKWWWGRTVPRDLFKAAEFAEAMVELRQRLDRLRQLERATDQVSQINVGPQRINVIHSAIDATIRGSIDDATMRVIADILEQVDDRALTKDAPTWKVKGLIALRGRAKSVAGRAPVSGRQAPASARQAPTSVRPASTSRPAVSARPAASGGETAPVSSVRPSTVTRPSASVSAAPHSAKPVSTAAEPDLDDELLAALDLDPELAEALELDGDEDELMAALELDPELEGAIELDAVALG